MIIFDLFRLKRKCSHEKVAQNLESSYCPDCGKLIKNEWYIARCACCGIKLVAKKDGENVMPINHYCSNCGSEDYQIEKLDQINFINVNYAVLLKKEVEINNNNFTTQCWEEKTYVQPKLLTQFQ